MKIKMLRKKEEKMETALKIEHLNKSLGKKQILNDVSFETYKGEIFGFLGPNGAGKTTTIKVAVGMLSLDDGTISICGKDLKRDFEGAMSNVGGIVENPEMYKYMSGYDNLKQYARMRKGVTKQRIDEVVEIVGLSNRINDKVSKYSLGMRQRLGVAQALLHNPQVLILDEPTNGLDPAGIKALRDILKKIAHEEKVSIIVSSHLMSEMELMCDRVGIIANGKMLAIKTLSEFVEDTKGTTSTYKLEVDDVDHAKEVIERFTNVDINIENDNYLTIRILSQSQVLISEINRQLIMNDVALIQSIKEETKSLEDAFIELTKEGGSQIA